MPVAAAAPAVGPNNYHSSCCQRFTRGVLGCRTTRVAVLAAMCSEAQNVGLGLGKVGPGKSSSRASGVCWLAMMGCSAQSNGSAKVCERDGSGADTS